MAGAWRENRGTGPVPATIDSPATLRCCFSFRVFRVFRGSSCLLFVLIRAIRGLPIDLYHSGGDAYCGGAGRNVFGDYCVRADLGVVADRYCPDNLGAGPDEHAIPQHRRFAFLRANRHLMLDLDVTAAAHAAVDHHPLTMHQHEPRPELRVPADDALSEDRIEFIAEHGQRRQAPLLRPLHFAVSDHGHCAVGQAGLQPVFQSAGAIQPLRLRRDVIDNKFNHKK